MGRLITIMLIIFMCSVAHADIRFKATPRGEKGEYQEAIGIEVLPAYYIPGTIALLDMTVLAALAMFIDLKRSENV